MGFHSQDGVTEYNTEEAAVLKKMLEIGHTRMVLCESVQIQRGPSIKLLFPRNRSIMLTDWNIFQSVKAWG